MSTTNPSLLSVVAKLRAVPYKAPSQKMILRNFEGLRLMVNAILMEKSGNADGAIKFEQMALNEMEKELRDHLSGVKHVVSFEDDQDVSIVRLGSML